MTITMFVLRNAIELRLSELYGEGGYTTYVVLAKV